MSVIQIHDCEQGSDAWHKARAGIPTASVFHSITKRLKRAPFPYSDERQRILYTLAGERITERVVVTYGGGDLARGKEMEDEARKLYEFQTGNACDQVGFITNSRLRAGCSPDSLIASDGGMEIKTKAPHLHFECLETGEVPEEHLPQCYGAMLITGRAWWDFVSYWPRLPLFVKRIERDEAVIARLSVEVQAFNDELDALVAKYIRKEAA